MDFGIRYELSARLGDESDTEAKEVTSEVGVAPEAIRSPAVFS